MAHQGNKAAGEHAENADKTQEVVEGVRRRSAWRSHCGSSVWKHLFFATQGLQRRGAKEPFSLEELFYWERRVRLLDEARADIAEDSQSAFLAGRRPLWQQVTDSLWAVLWWTPTHFERETGVLRQLLRGVAEDLLAHFGSSAESKAHEAESKWVQSFEGAAQILSFDRWVRSTIDAYKEQLAQLSRAEEDDAKAFPCSMEELLAQTAPNALPHGETAESASKAGPKQSPGFTPTTLRNMPSICKLCAAYEEDDMSASIRSQIDRLSLPRDAIAAALKGANASVPVAPSAGVHSRAHKCRVCGCTELYSVTVQLRSADEGMSELLVCTRCGAQRHL